MNTKTAGVLAVLGASIMWAVEPVLAKLAYRTNDIVSIFAARTLFCLAVVALYILLTDRRRFIVRKKHLPALVYISLVATLFADLIYVYALSKVAVLNAVLIGHMQPVFIILLGFVFLKSDKIGKFDYLGIIFMISAGILVTTRTLQNLAGLRFGSAGDLYVLLAAVAWATTSIVTRRYLTELPGSTLSFYRFLFAGVVFIAYAAATRGIRIDNFYQAALGVVIGIGTILYYEGLIRIKAAQVAALELSTPFYATVIAFVVLGEYITPMQALGIISLFIGIFFLSKKEGI
jgi:drug/metabolite transporter (DMT)-like permease